MAILIPAVIGYVAPQVPCRAGCVSACVPLLLRDPGWIPRNPIASYTILGEKVEKGLEPLLATPTTDSEILLGKGIAAFLPPLAPLPGGSALFVLLMDLTTEGKLGYYYLPDSNSALVLLVPLSPLMSVQN